MPTFTFYSMCYLICMLIPICLCEHIHLHHSTTHPSHTLSQIINDTMEACLLSSRGLITRTSKTQHNSSATSNSSGQQTTNAAGVAVTSKLTSTAINQTSSSSSVTSSASNVHDRRRKIQCEHLSERWTLMLDIKAVNQVSNLSLKLAICIVDYVPY